MLLYQRFERILNGLAPRLCNAYELRWRSYPQKQIWAFLEILLRLTMRGKLSLFGDNALSKTYLRVFIKPYMPQWVACTSYVYLLSDVVKSRFLHDERRRYYCCWWGVRVNRGTYLRKTVEEVVSVIHCEHQGQSNKLAWLGKSHAIDTLVACHGKYYHKDEFVKTVSRLNFDG